ncbi:MAG: M14 family zinc carboxypeptidase [bacterium]|nr:M14 family zinc carboxypeptidase [bacterium]
MHTVMKVVVLLSIALTLALGAQAEEYRHHSQVKVNLGSEARLQEFSKIASRLDVVPGETRLEPHVIALPEDLALLERFGFSYTVVHADIEQFYASRLALPLETDSLGGYHTYHDIMMYMDSLVNVDTHGIITQRWSIGQSLQGRDLWVTKISDNPDDDEDEPEVFFNSLIHCREPAAMEAVLYMMRYLVANYGTNPDVTNLVNTREMYFLPCVNPDGYEYNRQTNPSGGGMWRKNRRDGIGIDLNRNFDAAWGLDNDGSTSYPNSGNETYRGTSAFSEPETQVYRDFVNSRQFACGDDYHTVQNIILYPWGTDYYDDDGLCADNAAYEMIVDSMQYYIRQVNGVTYNTGTAWQLLYNVNGGSFDWEYGEQNSHWKMMNVTTEVGNYYTDGFWPAQSRIFPLAAENLPANLFLARIAEQFQPPVYCASRIAECQSEWNGDNDGVTEPGEGLELLVTLKNLGRWTLSSLHGTLSSADPYVTITDGEADWATLNPIASGANSGAFQISVSSGSPTPYQIPVSLLLTASGGWDTTLTFNVTVGLSMFEDNVEGGTNGWTSGGLGNLWHISTVRAESPTHSWYCGNDGGTYNGSMGCWLMSPVFVVGPGDQLEYDQWYSIESGYDVGYLEVNRGFGWVQLGSPTTGASSGWVHAIQDLGVTCAGTAVQIRFRFVSDGSDNQEGWYVDNIQVGPQPEFSLQSPAVTPDLGDPATEFTYSILYTSPTNVAPQSAQLFIDDAPHVLTTADYTYSDGSLFALNTTLPAGTHDYYFLFEGATMQLRVPTDGVLTGPLVGNEIVCYDFETDQAWTVGADDDNAGNGLWNRADPEGTSEGGLPVQPEDDHSTDPAVACYVTDSRAGTASGSYDVDGGRTTLLSPVWDLSEYQSVALHLWTWYTNRLGNNPTLDTFRVAISSDGGTSWTNLIQTSASWEYWKNDLFFLENFVTFTDQMRLRVVASDFGSGSLVEAAVDDVCLLDVGALSIPTGFTVLRVADEDSLTLRWSDAGAPLYRVYSSESADGPFTTEVGATTATSLTIPLPASEMLFYRVVSATE